MVLHPILLVVAIILASSTVISYSGADSLAIRAGALVFIASCTWQCIATSMEFMVRSPWASLVGGYSVTLLFHYIDIALLGKWSFDGQPFLKALGSGLSLTVNSRFIGTSEQVKHVSLRSAAISRSRFLWRTARFILLSYMALDVMDSSADPEVTAKYLSSSNVPLLRRVYRGDVSVEEIVVRFFAVIGAGIGLVAVQGGCHRVFAFLSVLFGLSAPSDWPTLYGSISDAYTLRRLWSRLWHQLNTHKLSSISDYLLHDVLGVPRGTKAAPARYARVVFAFAVSGLMHLLIDMSVGLSIYSSGALSFFCAQVLGIAIEDAILTVYCRCAGYNKSQPPAPSSVQKFIGYIWVCSYLVWTLPAYMFPIMSLEVPGGNNAVVPLSVIGMLRRA